MITANNALRKSYLAVVMGMKSLFFVAMVLTTCNTLVAQDQEKKSEEKKTEETSSTAKPDATADNTASGTKSGDRAAETRGQARALPATPVDDRSARTAAKSKGDITFDDIKFGIEKDGKFERKMLTEEIEKLNKKTVRIRGYILPASVFQQTGIKKFVLVRDNQECCFGPGAALYDCVMIEMADGKSANFTTRPVAVRGTFTIDSESYKYPDGGHYAIYKMVATEVK
jgi:hypothetical protein